MAMQLPGRLFRRSAWITSSSEPGFEHVHRNEADAPKLYIELKDCLFPKSSSGSRRPAIPGPTENLQQFEKAMSIVAILKDIGRKEDRIKMLITIKKRMERHDMMNTDFPFYISLVGYFSSYWKIPPAENDEYLDDVVKVCKQKFIFEAVKVSEMIKIIDGKLLEFLHQSAASTVDDSDGQPILVSTLLFNGCLRLVQDFDMYSSVLWISIAIVVKYKGTEEKMPGMESDKIWKKHLVEKSNQVQFSEGDLRKIKHGIKIIQYIEKLIPGNYASIFYLSHAFNGSTQYSLKFASKLFRMIIEKIGMHEARNASNFVRVDIQQKIDPKLARSDESARPTVSLDFINQGIKVLHLFDGELQKLPLENSGQKKVLEDKKALEEKAALEERKDIIRNEVGCWIDLLMQILLKHGNAESCFDLINRLLEECGKSPYMRQRARDKLKELVEGLVARNALPMKLFHQLYHAYGRKAAWEKELIRKYVKSYPFSEFKCDLNDEHWKNFFKDLSKELTDVEFENCVLEFFKGCQFCDMDQKHFVMDFFKLMIKDSFYINHLKEVKKFVDFFEGLLEELNVLDLPLKKILKYSSKSKGEVGDLLLSMLQKEMASVCATNMHCDDRVIDHLGMLSNELKVSFTGRKYTFCWEIVNAVYSSIPMYHSSQFFLKKYEEFIRSTSIIVVSKFKDWYKIDAHYSLDVTDPQKSKLASKGEHFFTWVTECLKEIVRRRQLLENESGDIEEIKTIKEKSPEMNKLLNIMLPKGEAQKFHFDQGRVQRAISDFEGVKTSIIDHLVRKTSSGGKEIMKDLYSLLVNYGVKFPTSLLKDVEECLVGHISDISTSGSVLFKAEVKLCTLKKLLSESIETFLKPLEENMKFFVFFSLCDSILFKSHLKAQLQCEEAVSVEDFNTGLKATKEVLSLFVNGNIEYNVLTLHGVICFNNKGIIDREFAIFEEALQYKHLQNEPGSRGYKDLKVLIELFEIANNVQVLCEVFEKFELNMIIEQQEFVECYQLASKFKDNQCMVDIKLHEAKEVLSDIRTKLYLEGSEECRCLDMLKTIRDSRELFKFILKKRFYGDSDTFRNLFKLITTQLQSMDYDENVLNNLPAAVRLLAPFCSIKDSHSVNPFKDFMQSLKENSKVGMEKLKIVNRHMSLIQRWFSTSNDNNLLAQLSDIARSGSFKFNADHKQPLFTLSYTSSSSPSEVVLQPDEVSDFSRAIRFYEGKEGEENMKKFKHSFEVVQQLIDIMQKANEVGYCWNLNSVACSMQAETLSNLVEETFAEVRKFIKKVTFYQRQYPWLLLISTPKILLLSDILSQQNPPVFSIVCEIIHITRTTWEKIESEVERAVVGKVSWQCDEDPVQQVGKFLQYTSKLYAHQPQVPKTKKYLKLKLAISRLQLVDIVYKVYGKNDSKTSLKPHLLLICGPTTSENTLEVMFKKAKKFIDTYMIIGIDNLSFKLQETLIGLVKDYHSYSVSNPTSVIHLIETKPSCLRDVSWMCEFMVVRESVNFSEDLAKYFRDHCSKSLNLVASVVHSQPGDGKTYYIQKQGTFHTITIDESFSIQQVICDLRKLYADYNKQSQIGIFFNFTALKSEGKCELWETLSWFFFHLLVLGYVEDDTNGTSFALLRGINWKIFIEAPSSSDNTAEEIFEAIPILRYACDCFNISNLDDYEIDQEVQLVCKYLQAHDHSSITLNPEEPTGWKKIFSSHKSPVLKISQQKDISQDKCYEIISAYMPAEKYRSKYSRKLFMRYMYKRCKFLDDSENIPNRQLLMDIMLAEVKAFTCSSSAESWSSTIKYQVIYKNIGGDNAIVLMCTNVDEVAEKISSDDAEHCSILVPKEREVHGFGYLSRCLSRAFGIKLKECVACLEEFNYVLTPDFAMKMINISECMECKSPLVISGETGVGKSFLIEVVSKLWNLSSANSMKELQDSLLNKIEKKGLIAERSIWMELKNQFYIDGSIQKDRLFGVLKEADIHELFQLVHMELNCNHMWTMLDLPIQRLQKEISAEENDVLEIIYSLLTTAKIRDTFFKLSVHSALTSEDINNFFKQPIELSRFFLKFSLNFASTRVPSVIVFIDELNTCSCGGCLKEIIADKTFHGERLPENLFVIAACNPHRGNSVVLESDFLELTWARGTYYVKELHPTLKFMMWDFGALTSSEERNYVHLKVEKIPSDSFKGNQLIDLIICSQQLIRDYAIDFISKHSVMISEGDAADFAKSCVSQRDIQRVFVFFFWLTKVYKKYRQPLEDLELRATLVSVGLVYYLRLKFGYRKKYAEAIGGIVTFQGMEFLQVFDEDVDWFISHLNIPDGIARTKALKQNLFATIACTCTKTPLIIVGKPGTSKTLSFNIAVDNLKGIDSDKDILKDTELFPSLDPQVYQCSRQTTSFEIDKLFRRAIKRQATYSDETNCVVFMDEAGLPEERHESLKILHHYLDEHKVAFVAISNHILDAAKTNRAISVVIPETTEEDLRELVKGCYKDAIMTPDIVDFCPAFLEVITNTRWKRTFGMRDFIHFLHYIYQRDQQPTIKLVLHALERNFNGTDDFDDVCEVFCQNKYEDSRRNVLEILEESIKDKCDLSTGYIRYKLIIDPSEDDSMISYLFKYGILTKEKTRRFISSNLFGDKGLAKMSDDKCTSKLYQTFRGELVSPEEAKWNLMHSVHAVHCSSKKSQGLKDHEELRSTILDLYFQLLDLKDEDCCLKHIHDRILNLQRQRNLELAPGILYDRLFAHFFSTYRPRYLSQDIHCLLTITSDETHHVSRSVSAFYLKRTLKSNCDAMTGIAFNPQVRKEIGYIIDTNLQRPLAVGKVAIDDLHETIFKGCPIGRLYFLLIEEELLLRNPTIADLIDQINASNKKFRKSNIDLEKILLSVENEALVQVTVKMVANKFSSSKNPDDVQYYFRQQISDRSRDMLKQLILKQKYGTILIKRMLEQNESLELFHKNYDILCDGLAIPNKLKKRMEPINMFSSFIASFFEPSHISSGVSYFSKVCAIIADLHNNQREDIKSLQCKLKEIIDLSQKIQHIVISGDSLFQMTIWLSVFQELFEKKKTSPLLFDCLKSYLDADTALLFKYLLDPTVVDPNMKCLNHLLEGAETGECPRRSIAVVIAGILGSPHSILHVYLFEPMKLKNTFIPGFMSEKSLMENVTYSMGTEVTAHGLYENYSQYQAAKNRGLLPQNMYILSWMNYSSILMSLVSKQVTYEDLSEVVVGKNSAELGAFMKSQLLVLWRAMREHFGLLHEELEYLIVEVMQRLVKMCKNSSGGFIEEEDRNAYERMVVDDVIVPSLSSLGGKSPYRNVEALKDARLLEDSAYLSIPNLRYIAASKPRNLLSEYLFAEEALEIVAKCLPTLVELYEFIHREISYRITKERARKLTIQRMLSELKKNDQLKKSFSQEDTKNFKEMIEIYFECSKEFIRTTGKYECKKWLLDENSTVISLMSTDQDDGDCLYRMIISMVEYHNLVIRNLCELGDVPVCDSSLCGISYTKPLTEPITLMERCSLTTSQRRRKTPSAIQCTEGMIDEEQIRFDLIEGYVRVKCRLTVHNFRKSLKFKTSATATDLEDELIAKQHDLPPNLLAPLSENLAKKLNHNFCSSSLAELRSTILGLLKIIGSLHQYCDDLTKLQNVTVKHYTRSFLLVENLSDSIPSKSSYLIDKLIRVELTKDQLSCLEEIQIGMLVSTVRLFCDWIKDGLCDFCEVDFIFKSPMSTEAEEELNQLVEKNINVDVLLELEALITKMQPDIMQKRSEHKMLLVKQLQLQPGDNSHLVDIVPKSIRLENYIYFRIKITKLIAAAKDRMVLRIGGSLENEERIWNEMVENPWMGLYKINEDEPITVIERFMSDTEVEPIAQFDTASEADTFSDEHSMIMEHERLSEFETSDDEDLLSSIGIPRKQLVDYTEKDLIEYLAENDMAEFNFIIEEDTNGEVISDWDVSDFEQAGVSTASDQVKLYLLFSRLKPRTKNSQFSTPYVVQFLDSQSDPSLKKYARIFEELEINGDILLTSKASFLRNIGVESLLDASKIIVFFRGSTGDDYDHKTSQQDLMLAINSMDIKSKSEYLKIVEDSNLSFHILKEGGVELLKELGITSRLFIKKLAL